MELQNKFEEIITNNLHLQSKYIAKECTKLCLEFALKYAKGFDVNRLEQQLKELNNENTN